MQAAERDQVTPLNALLAVVILLFGLAYLGLSRLRLVPPDNDPASYLLAHRTAARTKHLAVCAGDSLTRGSVSANYVDLLASRLPAWDFVNAGVNSELAFNLAARLEQIVALEPDAVTILIGTNDVNATFGLRSALGYYAIQRFPERPNPLFFRENLTLIVRRLKRETKARIALFSIPPIAKRATTMPICGRRNIHPSSGTSPRTRRSPICPCRAAHRLPGIPSAEPASPAIPPIRRRRTPSDARENPARQKPRRDSASNGFRLLVDGLHLNPMAPRSPPISPNLSSANARGSAKCRSPSGPEPNPRAARGRTRAVPPNAAPPAYDDSMETATVEHYTGS